MKGGRLWVVIFFGLALIIIAVVAFNKLRAEYCWFGYLSSSCMYMNAPVPPDGAVY